MPSDPVLRSATSEDGRVRVTADPSGRLHDLHLAAIAAQGDLDALARAVLAAAASARSAAARAAADGPAAAGDAAARPATSPPPGRATPGDDEDAAEDGFTRG